MKVCKPLKVAALTRVVEYAKRSQLHVTAIFGFPLEQPRALFDEFSLWKLVAAELGSNVLDEGLCKSRGEVLVAGRYHTGSNAPVTTSYVKVTIGTIDKTLIVTGNRYLAHGRMSLPQPFKEMAVDWAHALGGGDDLRNPYGIGLADVEFDGQKVRPLPNIEPSATAAHANHAASFGPMDMSFGVRRKRAGTFRLSNDETATTGLPDDHEPTLFNAASEDQWIEGVWRGDERFLVENMNPDRPRLEGELPGLVARAFVTLQQANGPHFIEIAMRCDTVWLFPSVGIGAVIFHGVTSVFEHDGQDVAHLIIGCEVQRKPRSKEHYHEALLRRLDKEKGSLADLSDSDLMPSIEDGVIPNMDLGPIAQWLKPGMLAMEKERHGAERRRLRMVDEMLAAGLDPQAQGLTEPLPPIERLPLDDLDALAKHLTNTEERIAAAEAEANNQKSRHEESRSVGVETDTLSTVSEEFELTGGPPAFSADQQLQQYAELAQAARTAGDPNLDLERKLASVEFQEELYGLQAQMFESYRSASHLMPLASPMTEEAAGMAKLVVSFARDTNESLAERDFTGADFRGLDLTGMDFSRAFLEAADLRGADLSGANFEGAVLAKADLRGAKLLKTRLRGANLGGANLEGATFDDADLTEAILMRSTTTAATFRGANLTGADMLESNWRGVDLRGARFERCTFLKADLTGVDLTGAHLVQTTFLECTLDDAVFDGANLHKASIISCKGERTSFVGADLHEAVILHKSELPDANFTDANLERCCMRTTVFRGARFHGARMTMSDLSECDASNAKLDRVVLKNALLIRTTLTHASARGVNLNEALLTNARIASTDFTGAQLTRADFTGAVGDDKTRFTEAVVAWTRFDAKASKGAST